MGVDSLPDASLEIPDLAVVGMAVLAILVLIPNDNCENAFNRPWIGAIGASPLMFAPASVGLLVAACGLCKLWRRTSLAIVLTICLVTLLVGLGHMTRVICDPTL